jgi:hypothetical protein
MADEAPNFANHKPIKDMKGAPDFANPNFNEAVVLEFDEPMLKQLAIWVKEHKFQVSEIQKEEWYVLTPPPPALRSESRFVELELPAPATEVIYTWIEQVDPFWGELGLRNNVQWIFIAIGEFLNLVDY